MKAKCKLCKNYMERIYKDEFGDEFWCAVCLIEVAINYDRDEIEVTQGHNGNNHSG